ncbi:valacyclovir hydrolase isoform X1 [Bacillus rossius redtenbacheri]|uniref:valacyclovir hydrolase isoform X1 n=1 Tax=Bacillus rossius redtenbacheri TaxID=93214 RepID=UPI002FDC8B0D
MHNIGRFALKNAFQSSCVHRVYLSTMKEKKVLVNGININYLKVGSGPKAVLCLPGALGSIWTDFKPQIENLSKSKFTLVAWDPPGYGKSRPPNRDFSPDFFRRDAGLAAALMKELGLDRFSLLGWSDGGITALVLAGTEPQLVDKMVVVGANAYIVEEELKMYESIRDISKWSERMRAPMIALYGEKYFRSTWSQWVDAFVSLYEQNAGDICKDVLPLIRCPTLVVHGKEDAMVAAEHPHYLAANIRGARLHIFEHGKHNLHLKFSTEFNSLFEEFLDS